MADLRVVFTRLGKMNVIRSRMTEATVAAAIVADLRENVGDESDEEILNNLVFHFADIAGQQYLLSVAVGGGYLVADAAAKRDAGVIDSGPFAGMTMVVPFGESDDDDAALKEIGE